MSNIKLRFAKLEDTKRLLEIYSYYVEKTNITFEYDVLAEEEFADRIKLISEKYPYIVAEKDDKIIGYAYANTFKGRAAYDWTVESSIYLDVNTRGQGIGEKLHDKLVEILQQQGIVTIEACITYPNDRSEQFHKKKGYEKVAHFNKVGYKFDKWHDVVWYEKTIANHNTNQQPIKLIGEIFVEFN